MVALQLAKRDGQVSSESQENLFLTRWLATALKQHRFPRDVAPDIEWLLKQGRTLGARAKMLHKLDYLWRSCTGELLGVSLDIENYCTLRLFFDLSTLPGLSRRNLPEAGIR